MPTTISRHTFARDVDEIENANDVVIEVLERAAEDVAFLGQLALDYSTALEGYELTWQERVALATGDLHWIESHIDGKLDERLVTRVIIPLLSREQW